MGLKEYNAKRRFDRTPEPPGKPGRKGHLYVIQKHAARRLHYDLRLQLGDALKSWAVPKGPSLDPASRSLAVEVEDHPVAYGAFEGTIPQGEYGGGTVMLWDRGWWEPIGDATESLRKGKLSFVLHGERLRGRWTLARMGGRDGDRRNWLLIKGRDDEARPGADVLEDHPLSIKTGRTMDEIAAGMKAGAVNPDRQGRARPKTPRRPAQRKAPTRKTPARKPPATVKKKPSSKKAARKATRKAPGKKAPAKAKPPRGRPPGLPPGIIERIPGAQPAEQPPFLPPQLALLAKAAPEGDAWLHETKFDGYRLLCVIRDGSVRLVSRRAIDWTAKFPTIAEAARRLPVDRAILDGEAAVLTGSGRTSFQRMQNIHGRLPTGVSRGAAEPHERIVYFAFDMPHCEGHSLARVPLEARKILLERLVEGADPAILYSEHTVGDGPAAHRRACEGGLEGIISKRRDAFYTGSRSPSWVKVKCVNRQEFVIGGFTPPEGRRTRFGALLLGYYERGRARRLRYCGRVGTGFTEETLRDVDRELRKRTATESPFIDPPTGSRARGVTWLRPELVCEVEFTEWTGDGQLRHPSFQGLRWDKEAREVRREATA